MLTLFVKYGIMNSVNTFSYAVSNLKKSEVKSPMNSEEIARLANVSRSTVSRVINNYPNVTEETRLKVQKIIDTHGYFPNNSARILTGKTNDIIGVFIAELEGDTSNKLVENIEYQKLLVEIIEKCKKDEFLVLVNIVKSVKECKDIEALFVNRMIYGGIFLGFPYKNTNLDNLAKKKYNTVFVDQYLRKDDPDSEYKKVDSRDGLGGYKATKYLIKKGHEKILMVAGDNRLASVARKNGYNEAMDESEFSKYVVKGMLNEDTTYNEVLKACKKDDYTAVFVSDDCMLGGVKKALDELNKKIGKDVSVVSYRDCGEASKLGITTLSVSHEEVAENCLELMDAETTKTYRRLTPKIIERSSVRKLN